MRIDRKIIAVFLSLKTTLILLPVLFFLLLYGSLAMPLNREFQRLGAVPLLHWMIDSPLTLTWWLWASIAVLALLSANTLFCSLESLMKKGESKNWMLMVAPQVIHAGFLFILVAHLVSSYGSFKGTTLVAKGSLLRLPNGLAVAFDSVNAVVDPAGYIQDWSAEVRYFEAERLVGRDMIRPNSPSFKKGFGIYIMTVQLDPYPAAVIEVSKEPGAPWALAGGILFLTGITSLLFLKVRREE